MTVRITLLALLASACASAPPLPTPPSTVPRAAVEMMCSRMRTEGMTAELRMIKTTQPLITPTLLNALAEATFIGGKPAVAAAAAAAGLPVESASCAKQLIESFDPKRDSDVMVLQFSSPFNNPFTRGQVGVVARLSLGDEAPTWFWIPMGERNGIWGAGKPTMLGVHD